VFRFELNRTTDKKDHAKYREVTYELLGTTGCSQINFRVNSMMAVLTSIHRSSILYIDLMGSNPKRIHFPTISSHLFIVSSHSQKKRLMLY
jgi:hypothetical protein